MFVQRLTGSCKTRQKHDVLPNKQLSERIAAPWKALQPNRGQAERTRLLRGAARALQNTALPPRKRGCGVTVLTGGKSAVLGCLQQARQTCRHS